MNNKPCASNETTSAECYCEDNSIKDYKFMPPKNGFDDEGESVAFYMLDTMGILPKFSKTLCQMANGFTRDQVLEYRCKDILLPWLTELSKKRPEMSLYLDWDSFSCPLYDEATWDDIEYYVDSAIGNNQMKNSHSNTKRIN